MLGKLVIAALIGLTLMVTATNGMGAASTACGNVLVWVGSASEETNLTPVKLHGRK